MGFMCLFLAGFGIWTGRLFLTNATAGRGRPLLISTLLYAVVAALSIVLQLWYHRRIIAQFEFDGSALRFRTLGNPEAQTRALVEVADVRPWRGRRGPIGYRLSFRDGGKAYLEYSVSNARALGEQLQAHVGLVAASDAFQRPKPLQ